MLWEHRFDFLDDGGGGGESFASAASHEAHWVEGGGVLLGGRGVTDDSAPISTTKLIRSSRDSECSAWLVRRQSVGCVLELCHREVEHSRGMRRST